MRIDAHVYTGHWPFRQLRGTTCRFLLEKMDRYAVDRSLVSSIHGMFHKNPQTANEELAREVKPFGSRFVPFAVLNPTYPDWKHDLDICVRQLGMKGLRLYPQYHDYQPTDDCCIELVQAAKQRGLPVAFSMRLIDNRQRSWLDIDREIALDQIASVVERVPDASYIVLHTLFGKESEHSATVFKQTRVVFDTIYGASSGIVGPNAWDLNQAAARYGEEKLVFGTASPFRDYVSPLLRIELFRRTDSKVQGLIWSTNIARLLPA